jgi:Family of unknown function (DUF5675)
METVTIQREPSTPTHTYGVMLYDNQRICDTIERPWLDNQAKISCIPAGTYTAIAFNSPHNGDVWLLENTTPRSMIEIHSANTADQLEGCIAVGTKGVLGNKPAVLRSKDTLAKLKQILPRKFTLIIKG